MKKSPFENPGMENKKPADNSHEDKVGNIELALLKHKQGLKELDKRDNDRIEEANFEDGDVFADESVIASAVALNCCIEDISASLSRKEEMLRPREAADMIELLESLFDLREGKMEFKNMTQAEFNKAVSILGEIEARIAVSDQQEIELINFPSNEKSIETRVDLDIVCAQAKLNLGKIVKINPNFIPAGTKIKEFMQSVQKAYELQFSEGSGDMLRKHRLLDKMKNRRTFSSRLIMKNFSALAGFLESSVEVREQ